ncbi:MAG: pantothenate kinase, partial [Alphaproteobacteria bacterium CG11_big_fil_rev_8_21_14_0_20_44_7]
MLLAIDVGNTNINLAVFAGEEIAAKWRVATIDNRTADEYIALITQLMSNSEIRPKDIGDIIISSVVPPIMMHINKMCRILFNKDPLIIGKNIHPKIKVEIDNPDELGSDRIVNSISTARMFGAPAIIIDFGTATTFDVVDAEGAYIGGVIAP